MGSSRPAEGLRNIRRTIKFARCQVKTVGMSLSHSCRSTINRQGITLPISILSFVNVSLKRNCRKKGSKTVRVTAAVYRGLAGFGQFNTPALGRHQELYKAFPPSSPLRFLTGKSGRKFLSNRLVLRISAPNVGLSNIIGDKS